MGGLCACSFFNQGAWEGKKTKPHLQVQTLLDMKWTRSKIRILITTQLILEYFAKFNTIYHANILQQRNEE